MAPIRYVRQRPSPSFGPIEADQDAADRGPRSGSP